MKVARRFAGVLGVLAVVLASCGTAQSGTSTDAQELLVAAASDLRPAFEEIGRQFESDHDAEVTFSFGSSGLLAQQVIRGAPFDVFVAANEQFVDDVIAASVGRGETKQRYAIGRLAMWSGVDGDSPASVEDLALPRFRRIVIANPEHAPYGIAARQALEAAGVFDAVQDRLVYGESVSDAQRIVETGNADVGIIALSLAMAAGGTHTLVPMALHAPLVQSLVVTATDANERLARKFTAFVTGPRGREIMARNGFEPASDSGIQ
jgi:molybdate transport system substrate-binding protein